MNFSHFDRNSVGRIIQDLDFLEYFGLFRLSISCPLSFKILTWAGTIHLLFSPFNSSILEPDLHLCFGEIEWGS